MFVLVRTDLSKSQQAVQATHAAIEATRKGLITSDIDHPHLVLCEAKSEYDLLLKANILDDKSIRYEVFREPDIGNEVTAIATEPLTNEQRKKLGFLKLLRLEA